jgi:lysozyme
VKNRNLFLHRDGKINIRSIVLSIGIITTAIAGISGVLFNSGLIYINSPDRQRFPIRGIDISNHQHQIDWTKFDRSQVDFVLIKATEGGDFKDPLFRNNWKNVQQKGAIAGAYHFFTFCKSGREQAQNYIETVPRFSRPAEATPTNQTLPPVIDLEFVGNCKSIPTPAALDKELNTFITIVEKFYNKKPILYVTYEFYDRYLQHKYPNTPIWISDFYSFNKLPTLSDSKPWLFWQYSERGRIAGISTLVDLNVFSGTKSQFERLVSN